jgi:Fur family transcriptional regulator, ferric uptake regulator
MDQFLKNKNLRVTEFRLEVLSLFIKYKHALEISDLEEELGKHDRITLYRTIKTFIDNGILHEIVLPGEHKKMALCDSTCSNHDEDSGHHSHEHVHFQCVKCGHVECIDQVSFPSVKVPGYLVEEVSISAKGYCKSCV